MNLASSEIGSYTGTVLLGDRKVPPSKENMLRNISLRDAAPCVAMGLTSFVYLTLAASPALAADIPSRTDGTCIATPQIVAAADYPDTLDPKLRGVALADLDIPEGEMVSGFLRSKGVMKQLRLGAVLSTSIVEARLDRLVVDMVVRAERFTDTDERRNKDGRVGLMRVTVPVASDEGLCDVGAPLVQWEKSLDQLNLSYRVSITEWMGVIDDVETGFRRVWPLGGGSIDRGVRVAGYMTSMTPTTEDAKLEKDYAWRNLKSPWYFRDKPYLPISQGRTYKRADGTTYKVYAESNIAFHIWQDKGFERGYFSHGCMRMRDEDLAELAAFVFAGKDIPMTLRTPQLEDADHPWPFDNTKYWQLKNYGTAEKPKTRLKYMLYETELGTLPLPSADEIMPLTFDEKPVRTELAAE